MTERLREKERKREREKEKATELYELGLGKVSGRYTIHMCDAYMVVVVGIE
jgi:hypothetical protein